MNGGAIEIQKQPGIKVMSYTKGFMLGQKEIFKIYETIIYKMVNSRKPSPYF